MNHARGRRPNVRASARKSSEKSSGGKAKWVIAAILILLMALGAWAFLPSEDPALARIHEIRDQMDSATPEQRRELFGQMREEYSNLSEESREQLRDEWRDRWEAREQQRLNEFFALSPPERIAKIDEQIREEEQRRQQRAERRARGGQQSGARGPGGPGGGGGPGRGDRAGRANRSNSDRLERRKRYLDRTAPQTRAQRSEYRRMRAERRKQLGLPSR